MCAPPTPCLSPCVDQTEEWAKQHEDGLFGPCDDHCGGGCEADCCPATSTCGIEKTVFDAAGAVLGLAGLVGSAVPGCGTSGDPVLPVTDVMTGPGGSWYQLYQSPATGMIYVSWALNSQSITVGVKEWAFGIELHTSNGYGHVSYAPPNPPNGLRAASCKPIMIALAGQPFTYFVDAGAAGWSTQASCTVTFDWHMSYGFEITANGPGGSQTFTFGGSYSCTSGVTYDSESIFRDEGSSSGFCVSVTC
jgi:hypothetical protein